MTGDTPAVPLLTESWPESQTGYVGKGTRMQFFFFLNRKEPVTPDKDQEMMNIISMLGAPRPLYKCCSCGWDINVVNVIAPVAILRHGSTH